MSPGWRGKPGLAKPALSFVPAMIESGPAPVALVASVLRKVAVVIVSPIDALPSDLNKLADLAHLEGFHFLDRLVVEFGSGTNTFSRPGEMLFEARFSSELAGIAGLNTDPYLDDPSIGRIRRLYVAPKFRRLGVAAALVGTIEQSARRSYTDLRLFTDTSAAASFYLRLGYSAIAGERKVSHSKNLADSWK